MYLLMVTHKSFVITISPVIFVFPVPTLLSEIQWFPPSLHLWIQRGGIQYSLRWHDFRRWLTDCTVYYIPPFAALVDSYLCGLYNVFFFWPDRRSVASTASVPTSCVTAMTVCYVAAQTMGNVDATNASANQGGRGKTVCVKTARKTVSIQVRWLWTEVWEASYRDQFFFPPLKREVNIMWHVCGNLVYIAIAGRYLECLYIHSIEHHKLSELEKTEWRYLLLCSSHSDSVIPCCCFQIMAWSVPEMEYVSATSARARRTLKVASPGNGARTVR